MKELDLLLGRWLERRWPVADPAARAAFERLLDTQDPLLAAWLLRGERPADRSLVGLIDDIVSGRD